ncbi:MAG TPA: OmpA family protein [Rhodopila sp.]|nr:OmpA family protein [Rhodopila sp.]
MVTVHWSRLTRIALTASCIAVSIGGSGWAQNVQMFDRAPSLDVLRSIMVPESTPGATRSIVMARPDLGASAQRATPASVAAPVQESAPMRQTISDMRPGEQAPPAPAPAVKRAPQVKPAAEKKPAAVGFRINFAFDSDVLPSSSHEMIDTVAEVMKETPNIKVRVEGHTDAVGTAAYNDELSKRRAIAVGEYLVKLGIDPSRLILVGKGMSDPLVKDPYDGQNRRVQFVRVG